VIFRTFPVFMRTKLNPFILIYNLCGSRDSSVVYSAGLRAGWSGVRVPAGAVNFSLHHRVHTGSGAHPVSYPMGTKGSFPGDKEAGAWSWPLTSIQCRGQECVEIYLHSPNTPPCRGAQLKHRNKFTFTFKVSEKFRVPECWILVVTMGPPSLLSSGYQGPFPWG
jgi:hypothetical protein